jgi:hypothetical protein
VLTHHLLRWSVIVAVMAGTTAADRAAFADQWTDVGCDQQRTRAACNAGAGTTPEVEEIVEVSDGELVCRVDGERVPCVTEDGWLGADGCRYLLQDVPAPAGVEGPGGSYLPSCPGDLPARRALVWLPDSVAPGPPALARHALSRLVLPGPVVGLSPAPPAAQLVGLPGWLWVEPGWWGSRSATASVPGVSVSVVAVPVRVVWSMGDGGVVSCAGAGTPYPRAGGDPASASPDCGYTYTGSSAGQPGGVFTAAATLWWEVSWSGGGMSGGFGPLSSTSVVDVAVAEVQTVMLP